MASISRSPSHVGGDFAKDHQITRLVVMHQSNNGDPSLVSESRSGRDIVMHCKPCRHLASIEYNTEPTAIRRATGCQRELNGPMPPSENRDLSSMVLAARHGTVCISRMRGSEQTLLGLER